MATRPWGSSSLSESSSCVWPAAFTVHVRGEAHYLSAQTTRSPLGRCRRQRASESKQQFLGSGLSGGKRPDLGFGTVENGYSAATILFVAVNVLHDLGQETISRPPDLMRRSVIDLERWTGREIDAKAFHEKGCWKMRWPRSPAKNRLSPPRGDSREEPQFRHAQVLRLVDDDMGERLFRAPGIMRADFGENLRRGDEASFA